MDSTKAAQSARFLQLPDIHQQWERDYRTADNEIFFESALDYIIRVAGPKPGSIILDAGCGTCTHAIRFARRGYRVQAVDLSETVLRKARKKVESERLTSMISVRREDLNALSFKDRSFDCIFCWGVLMHVPDLPKALSELARVLNSSGKLVISESNRSSLQGIALRTLKRLLRREKADTKIAPQGVEYWSSSSTGSLVTRESDIGWLVSEMERRGLSLRVRVAGQFTELYTRTNSSALKRFIHAFNLFWFTRVRFPQLAFGNIMVFEKWDRAA